MHSSNKLFLLLALLALLAIVTSPVLAQSVAAHSVTFLPATADDLNAARLAAPFKALDVQGLDTPAIPREAVSLSWPLAEDATLDLGPAPQTQESREYWLEADAAALERGVPLYTTAPGALVRLSPVSGRDAETKSGLDPATLTLVDPAGVEHAAGNGMEVIAGAEAVARATAKTGVSFPAGTTAFRLDKALGAGAFELRGHLGAGRVLVHVFEPESTLELRLGTPRSTFLHGQALRLEAALENAGEPVPVTRAEGFVISPAGRTFPARFDRGDDGLLRGRLELDAAEAPAPGLWEAHLRVDGRLAGQPVPRFARVAFDCAVPTARLDGTAALVESDGMAVRLGVEVAAAGRYDVRGVLYGTAADGSLQPVGVAQSARWLEPGSGSLVLGFSSELTTASGLSAPFEVRDLRLVDQGRMGVLHRQARGLVIE